MKNLLKELGKYFFDVSKILLAIAVITPYVKDENISITSLLIVCLIIVVGSILTYKGGTDK